MTRPILIVDTETTALEPAYETGAGVIWELGVVEYGSGNAHLWRMEPKLAVADPGALRVGKYYERTAGMLHHSIDSHSPSPHDLAHHGPGVSGYWTTPAILAPDVARVLDDATIVAANPAFDAAFLTAFLRHHGQAPTWHYRLRDIGSMAWAWLKARERALEGTGYVSPKIPAIDAGTDDFADALGVDRSKFERHSALGDCMLEGAMLDVITGPAS